MIRTYNVDGVLNSMQAKSVVAKLMYSIEKITNCRLAPDEKQIVVELAPGVDEVELSQTIALLIRQAKHNRHMGTRITHRTLPLSEPALYHSAAGDALGNVRRDQAVTIMQQLDRLFEGLALKRRARLRSYPAMIAMETLEKCGYITSFPQNVHLVSEFPHKLAELEKVRGAESLDRLSRLSPYALSPAVCFHCYAELENSRIKEPMLLTARGTCFRHEAAWRLGDYRLNEFQMREVVLFGDELFVEAARKRFIDDVWELFNEWGFSGRIETATDPFYFSDEYGKGQLQLMGNMKYELIVELGGEEFAIASFNNMSTSLCKPFGVTDAAFNPLHSGCIAFGIDRWLYALLRRYGPEVRRWPGPVRAQLQLESSLVYERGSSGR